MTFAQRQLTFTFSTDGTFDGKNNIATLRGLRAHALIKNAGGIFDSQLDLTIWGMQRSMMNQLATFGLQINLLTKKSVLVEAGDVGGTSSIVFQGNVITAEANLSGQPEVSFHVAAQAGILNAVAPANATSYRGSADVATIMQSFATQMNLKFENSGVSVKLNNPYFSGSLKSQYRACAKAAGINASIVNGNTTLAIWPKNGIRNGQIPLISPATGLEGYPTFNAYGIGFSTLFNPSIGLGQQINMQSSITQANEQWGVYNLTHDLACELPGGRWHSDVLAYSPKYQTPPVKP